MKSSGPSIVSRLRWLAVLALSLPLSAATLTFSAVADTSLFQAKPDFDLGGTSLVSGTNQQYSRSRALFRFDFSALPEGAVVTAAQVSLIVTRRPDPDQHGGPVNSDFSLYRLLVSWGEGTGSNETGSVPAPGDATWNQRHFGSESWADPGGLIGVDYSGDPSATTSVSGLGDYVWGSSAGLVGDVIAWQANPAENFGYILISQDEVSLGTGRRFASKEQPGGIALPAQLTVTYTVVPEPSVVCLSGAGLAALTLRRVRRD